MHGQREGGERHAGIFLDIARLILGIAIVVSAVLSFINPEGNHMFFLLVFLLAASLNAVSGMPECKIWGRDKKGLYLGILQLVLAVGLGVLGALSVISIWTQR